MTSPKIKQNKYGYYSVVDLPSQHELESYYNLKYYQTGKGSYELNYSHDEINYFFNKIEEKVHVVSKFKELTAKSSVIDIGCGEGWVLKYFKDRGIDVVGLDYSAFGCEKNNPDCMSLVLTGDIYKNLNNILDDGKKFDLVWLDNVLEHVIDPLDLLAKCNSILSADGVLMVEVPNDFSVLQNYLKEKEYIDKQFWIAYPDHLSYFNKDGLDNLAREVGLKSVFTMSDFPIEINLLNTNVNYVNDRTVGKSCYLSKIKFENLLHSISVENAINFYKSLMKLGIGRCVISFFIKE